MSFIHFDPSFEKAYKALVRKNSKYKKKIQKALLLFGQNQHHPSLNTEKLSDSDIWTIRIDQKKRIFFIWSRDGKTAIFFLVGGHDLYKKIGKRR